MRTSVKEGLVPSRSKHQAPIKDGKRLQTINNHYTTAVIGGNAAGQVHGWESIQPTKRSNKPQYLLEAQAKIQQAWVDYLGLVDTLEVSGKWDPGSVEAAWDVYDEAKRKCEIAWDAYCQGYESLPIPF